MSRSKGFLPPYKSLVAGDLSAATLTSAVTDIRGYDDVAVQMNVTGNGVGVFTVNGSLDGANFVPVTLDPVPTADGVDKQILINMGGLCFPFLRVGYTKTSGTGAVDVWVTGKAI